MSRHDVVKRHDFRSAMKSTEKLSSMKIHEQVVPSKNRHNEPHIVSSLSTGPLRPLLVPDLNGGFGTVIVQGAGLSPGRV